MNVGDTATRRSLLIVTLAAVALTSGSTGLTAATLLLVGDRGSRSRGVAGLAAWILGGALVGGAIGYGAHSAVQVPLSQAGAIGLGVALGGGIGGISHFLSAGDPATADDERMTVDMARNSPAEPRPADLFDDHPDPVLYVTDAGGGPVVRAANDAYEDAFDLPATTIEDAPLGEVLRVADDADSDGADVIAASLADGKSVDQTTTFETADGQRRYRVRSVAAPDDGYLLFTPVAD